MNDFIALNTVVITFLIAFTAVVTKGLIAFHTVCITDLIAFQTVVVTVFITFHAAWITNLIAATFKSITANVSYYDYSTDDTQAGYIQMMLSKFDDIVLE